MRKRGSRSLVSEWYNGSETLNDKRFNTCQVGTPRLGVVGPSSPLGPGLLFFPTPWTLVSSLSLLAIDTSFLRARLVKVSRREPVGRRRVIHVRQGHDVGHTDTWGDTDVAGLNGVGGRLVIVPNGRRHASCRLCGLESRRRRPSPVLPSLPGLPRPPS